MSRWGHGHSLATGALVALLLSERLLWTLTVVFVAGVLAGRSWGFVARLGRLVKPRSRRWT